jgi:hypothetical protein
VLQGKQQLDHWPETTIAAVASDDQVNNTKHSDTGLMMD